MKRITLGAAGVLLTLSQAGIFSQGALPPKLATDITAAATGTPAAENRPRENAGVNGAHRPAPMSRCVTIGGHAMSASMAGVNVRAAPAVSSRHAAAARAAGGSGGAVDVQCGRSADN